MKRIILSDAKVIELISGPSCVDRYMFFYIQINMKNAHIDVNFEYFEYGIELCFSEPFQRLTIRNNHRKDYTF